MSFSILVECPKCSLNMAMSKEVRDQIKIVNYVTRINYQTEKAVSRVRMTETSIQIDLVVATLQDQSL